MIEHLSCTISALSGNKTQATDSKFRDYWFYSERWENNNSGLFTCKTVFLYFWLDSFINELSECVLVNATVINITHQNM